jgi:hypothetical protein
MPNRGNKRRYERQFRKKWRFFTRHLHYRDYLQLAKSWPAPFESFPKEPSERPGQRD